LPRWDAEVLVPGFRSDDDTPALLGRLPRLRLVQLRSAGAERWVDRLPPGVALSDCRGAHGALTAEWVVAGLLALLRELPAFVRNQDGELWLRQPSETLIGKRVLLVGAGDVAERLARRLDGFDLAALSMVGRTGRAGVHSADDLPGLLPSHDVVVLLVPLTPQTVRMVGAEFLAAMPDGAVLVNASRGGVVETSALVAELRSGRLRAVLDVVDPDPLPPGHALWKMPGVLITPHVGGIGTEASWRERAYAVVRDQLLYVSRGRHPPNLVVHGY
jgi:phosphoglycerate dehydrogenase-like enzyme